MESADDFEGSPRHSLATSAESVQLLYQFTESLHDTNCNLRVALRLPCTQLAVSRSSVAIFSVAHPISGNLRSSKVR